MQNGNTLVSSTAALAVADRFPFWADVVTQTFVPLECDAPNKSGFAGTIRHRQIGTIGIADVCASAQRVRRTPATIARAPSDDLIVALHIDGPCRVGRRLEIAELLPGDGVTVETAQSYSFDFSRPFRQLVLKIPSRHLGKTCARGQQPLSFRSSLGRLLRHLATSVLDDNGSTSNEEERGIERAFAELLRSAASPQGGIVRDAADRTLRYTASLSLIERYLNDPALDPAFVATRLGISTRSLARLFAEHGSTVDRVIWRSRLDAAKRDLLDPRHRGISITRIAFSWAFNDSAHFSRSFSRVYGMSPRRFRELNSDRF